MRWGRGDERCPVCMADLGHDFIDFVLAVHADLLEALDQDRSLASPVIKQLEALLILPVR